MAAAPGVRASLGALRFARSPPSLLVRSVLTATTGLLGGALGLMASTSVWSKTLLELGPSSPLAKDFQVLIAQHDPQQRGQVPTVHYDAQSDKVTDAADSQKE